MGIPEWMLSIDGRKTKMLHNGACIQFLLHFKGKYLMINKIIFEGQTYPSQTLMSFICLLMLLKLYD